MVRSKFNEFYGTLSSTQSPWPRRTESSEDTPSLKHLPIAMVLETWGSVQNSQLHYVLYSLYSLNQMCWFNHVEISEPHLEWVVLCSGQQQWTVPIQKSWYTIPLSWTNQPQIGRHKHPISSWNRKLQQNITKHKLQTAVLGLCCDNGVSPGHLP